MKSFITFLSLVAFHLMLVSCLDTPEPESEKGIHAIDTGTVLQSDTLRVKLAAYCSDSVFCGNIAYVDCHSATDGPSYYIDRTTGKSIANCGGNCFVPEYEDRMACMGSCPPKEWTCKY